MSSVLSRFLLLAGLCCTLGFSSVALSATANTDARLPQHKTTLLDIWFKLQEAGPVYAPYAYIQDTGVEAKQAARKQALFAQVDNLIWRVQAVGQHSLATALSQWRRHIGNANAYRTPGHWGPAALLSSPQAVAIESIAAVGACSIPNWIEIWSATGVKRVPWQPDMQLNTLLLSHAGMGAAGTGSVTLITPYGAAVERAIEPWKQHGETLSPGMRVIVPMPLGPQASTWLAQALAAFLAHLQPGDDCRQLNL